MSISNEDPQGREKRFFIQECVKLARELSVAEAREFLKGLLAMIGDCEEAHDIRRLFVMLDESDRQMELRGP